MIAGFISVEVLAPSEGLPERMQIAFLDSEERSWCVWVPMLPNAQQLDRALKLATIICTDPDGAVGAGIITQSAIDLATAARDKMRLNRSHDKGQRH